MKERTTQVLLVVIAVLLAAHLYRAETTLPFAQADEVAAVSEVLRARTFELVNQDGKVVAQLFAGEKDGGGNIRLRSGDGLVRVKLGATPDGAGLLLMDPDVEPAVQLGTSKAGTSLTLSEKGKEKQVIKP